MARQRVRLSQETGAAAERNWMENRIVELLEDEDELTRGELIDAVASETRKSRRTIEQAIDDLAPEGRVQRRKCGRNAIYSRPPQGELPMES